MWAKRCTTGENGTFLANRVASIRLSLAGLQPSNLSVRWSLCRAKVRNIFREVLYKKARCYDIFLGPQRKILCFHPVYAGRDV